MKSQIENIQQTTVWKCENENVLIDVITAEFASLMSEQLLSFLVSLGKYTIAAAAAAWRWQNTQNGTRIRRWYSWTVDKQQENIYWSWVHMSHIGVPCCHESVPLLLWLRLIALFFFARCFCFSIWHTFLCSCRSTCHRNGILID